jgi:cell division protein ZapE
LGSGPIWCWTVTILALTARHRQPALRIAPMRDQLAVRHRMVGFLWPGLGQAYIGRTTSPRYDLASVMVPSLARQYDLMVSSGRIDRDAAQEKVVGLLAGLAERLKTHRRRARPTPLGWMFGRRGSEAPVRGVYLWGPVGRGKTMLMDMLFEALPMTDKRRVHFHAFMADVHDRIHAWRQEAKAGRAKGDDPIAVVAEALAREASLLCFDEFSVNDIADAMILGRLFQALYGHGVVVVATSNVEPKDLYRDGLNRALFLPFIAMLEQHMEIVRLEARADFRLEKLAGSPVYYAPADEVARAALDRLFERLTGATPAGPVTLQVHGRDIVVPRAAAGVARFSFSELCDRPLGAADYIAVAQRFHTLVIDGVPVMDESQRNLAKRFITLIDVLYEQHVKLVLSAEAGPTALYRGTVGREAFEFERTGSRLIEMQSEEYLSAAHGRNAPRDAGDTADLVET